MKVKSYMQNNVEESLIFFGVDLSEIFFWIGRLFFCLEVAIVFSSLFIIFNLGYLAY